MKNYEAEGFKCTDPDTNQWVKKITDTRFLVIEGGKELDIDLEDYTDQEIEEFVSPYYSSVLELASIYDRDGIEANQIIAECIAEQIIGEV